MDKKYTLIGLLFIAAAIALIFVPREDPPPPAPVPVESQTGSLTSAPDGQAPTQELRNAPPAADGTSTSNGSAAAATEDTPAAPWIGTMYAPLAPTPGDEQLTTLENDFVAVRLTNYGGAIHSVALKRHDRTPEGGDPLVLNVLHHAPALSFSKFAGADFAKRYELVSSSATEAVFRTIVQGQLEVTRTFRIHAADSADQDAYVIRSETALRNLTNGAISLPADVGINLGTGQLVHDTDDPSMLTIGRFDGDKLRHTPRSALDYSSGFLGMFGGHPEIPFLKNDGPTVWASVENQFFVTVVTPDKPGIGVTARRVELPLNGGLRPRFGLVGEMLLEPRTIPAGGVETMNLEVYSGPKEYKRLVRLGEEQDQVMGWGNILGGIAKILLLVMTSLHGLVGNWGVAIIATTITLRVILWPLTGIQTRAAKRMAKISGPLKELQEKYKDNRQKLTEETMKLWKQHKVNPVAGCMPLLVQMPIFIGLFSMLRSAAELRFAEFLWIEDLSAPDTIATIPLGFMDLPINVMVLLWGLTTHIQMRLSPTPSTDNMQVKVMKFMPVIMVVMFYTFSSGLALYWTASNLFTIFQQWVTNRQKDAVETAPAATGAKPGAAERAKPVRDAKVATVTKKKQR